MKYNPVKSLVRKITLFPALVAGTMLAGCSSDQDQCEYFSEPGEYEVNPCDVFVGQLGVNFRVDGFDKYGQVIESYIDDEGKTLRSNVVFGTGWEIAHYGLNLYSKENKVITLSNDPKDLYDRCVQLLSNNPEADPVNHCSLVSPTESLQGEVLSKSENGYFGKTNNPAYPQLAECAAKEMDNIVLHTSKFLGLPALHHGGSYMYIFKDKTLLETGANLFSVSVWYYKKDDLEAINDLLASCDQKLNSGDFAKGGHELTHAFVIEFDIPFTFNEGLANYVPKVLNTAGGQWNSGSACTEDGFKKGLGIIPYIKYYDDAKTINSYISGECFWQKLVYDYSTEAIPKLMDALKENIGKNKTFEEALLEANIDPAKYQQWGLGE